MKKKKIKLEKHWEQHDVSPVVMGRSRKKHYEKFPKYKGQRLDKLSQAKFRRYKNIIANSIQMTDDTIPKNRIEIIAWNCAYEILTSIFN